jgi:Ankyrin repeats (3 copies)
VSKNRRKLCHMLGWVLLLYGCTTEAKTRLPDPAAQRRIERVISELPVDSSLRRSLEMRYVNRDGQRHLDEINRLTSNIRLRHVLEEAFMPDGIHEPWMDDMNRAGVKSVMFEVHGVWNTYTHFHPHLTKRIIYRRSYDGPGSQITDLHELTKFRESGLEAELQEAAFRKSKKAIWIGADSPPKDGEACIVNVYLFDDEWLVDDGFSTNLPGIGRYNPEEFPLGYAAALGDLLTVRQQLSAQKFPEHLLDVALFQAVHYPSDNTDVISLLLKAGANVNAKQRDGTTPLMDAVASLNLTNIKLLLSSGADVNQKDNMGWTAYSLAQRQVKQFQESGSPQPEYMPEILKLLKPGGP